MGVNDMFRKLLSILLTAVMLLALAGCSSDQETIKTLLSQNQSLNEELAALKADSSEERVYTVNAFINGKDSVPVNGRTEFTAETNLEEGFTVDYWSVNGEAYADATGSSFTFTVDASAVVEAVVRPEKKVTAVNAVMYFLDQNNVSGGEEFKEFIFEDSYVNPLTGENVDGGKISLYVKAVVPAGHAVDYWLINGVKYDFDYNVLGFKVENLDEATQYEPVFCKLQETQVPQQPSVYYQVNCTWCSFNGQTSGKVPAGTTITVVADGTISGDFFVNGGQYNSEWVTAITVTINCDTNIEFYAVVN